MAITLSEDLMLLSEVAKLLPRRDGKKVHTSSIYRWTTTGCRGIVLESVQIGATRATSREALERFVQRLTAAAGLKARNQEAADPCKRADDCEAELTRLGL